MSMAHFNVHDVVTHQLQWQTKASGWAASAACSHHPTAGVGHSRGFYRHFDFIRGTKTIIVVFSNGDGTIRRMSTLHVCGRISIHSITDEHGNFGTSFNSRDDYCISMGLYGKSRGGDDGQEDNVATPEVHQRGGDV
jgi:hypothetical protein